MKKIIFGATTLLAGPAMANTGGGTITFPVPEISALEGTAALAVVATVVLLAWERRRRAS